MSTLTQAPVSSRTRTARDRKFYLVMAIASAALVFAGFSRSYYLRPHFSGSRPLSLLVHVHGAVFTAWILYFVLQTALIAATRPAIHRRLGWAGAALGCSMLLLGLTVAVTAMRLHHGTPFIDAETTFLVGLIDILSFGIFFVLGWRWRRDREAHQRLMLLSVVVGLLGASLGRIVGFGVSIAVVSLLNFALLFAGPIYDLLTRRRIHKVYLYGCLYALATFTPLRFVVGATPWWHRTAHVLAHIP